MGIRALIVDDSAVMRSMIISTLRRSAVPVVAVHQAGRADEALALLARAEVDLVLIDLDMATSDGEALVDAIRANPAWTEVACVLTSSTISGREGFSERGLMGRAEAIHAGGRTGGDSGQPSRGARRGWRALSRLGRLICRLHAERPRR